MEIIIKVMKGGYLENKVLHLQQIDDGIFECLKTGIKVFDIIGQMNNIIALKEISKNSNLEVSGLYSNNEGYVEIDCVKIINIVIR